MADYLKKRFDSPIPQGHQIYASFEPAGLVRRKDAATQFAKGRSQWIELEREPSNPQDPNAIRVVGCWRGWILSRRAPLGYVPRHVAKVIADLDAFEALAPRLMKVYVGRTGYVEVDVQLTGPKDRAKHFKAAMETQGSAATSHTAEEGRRRQLETFSETEGLAGLQWAATMSLKTPLRSLERHGEIYRGDPLAAPTYGGPAEGTWVPVVDWEAVGLDSPPAGTMWSVIGTIPQDGGDFLPFLLEFRRIVESQDPVPTMLERIDALCDSRPEFQKIAQRIVESGDAGQHIGGPNFARKFFAQRLEEIPGIGPGIARRLFDAGFHTLSDLATATEEELRQVQGVGQALAGELRKAAGES